jgi:serine/threonine-protein kinase
MADDRPKLSTLKYQVQGILHTDAAAAIMSVADQKDLATQYAIKVIKKEEASEDDEEDDSIEARAARKRAGGSSKPDPDAFARACARAQACAEAGEKVGHPSLLKYYDFSQKKNWLFQPVRGDLLMEFVPGASLDKLAKSLEVADLVLIARQVAAAVAHLHRRNVLHGDLKPSKIILSRGGQPKVLGFGLSLVSEKKWAMGSKLYAAPEQIKDKALDEKTDLYAFGATFYHLLTGKPANSPTRQIGESGKIALPQTLNPKVTTALSNILVGCLQSSPSKRPESFFDLQEPFDSVVNAMHIGDRSLRGLAGGAGG